LREVVVLPKDAQPRESFGGEDGDLPRRDTTAADGGGATDTFGVDLDVVDVGVLADGPAAVAEELGDGLQGCVALASWPTSTAQYKPISLPSSPRIWTGQDHDAEAHEMPVGFAFCG